MAEESNPLDVLIDSEMDQERANDILDEIRESGVMNMFAGALYLHQYYGVPKMKAKEMVSHWMRNYSSRHNS
tara:strand:- start:26855 stop:27070 length:216 start_codon:yes stop_codon:yes gene_type:complete